MTNKSQKQNSTHAHVKRSSVSGQFLKSVKKDINDSVALYFTPMKAIGREFGRAVSVPRSTRHKG